MKIGDEVRATETIRDVKKGSIWRVTVIFPDQNILIRSYDRWVQDVVPMKYLEPVEGQTPAKAEMSDQERMRAIIYSDLVSDQLKGRILYDLMYGNRKFLGDAIVSGKKITCRAYEPPYRFDSMTSDYIIKEPSITFNDYEINAPATYADCKEGVDFWGAYPNVSVEWNSKIIPEDDFKRGIVFFTKEDAQAYRAAAGWILPEDSE